MVRRAHAGTGCDPCRHRDGCRACLRGWGSSGGRRSFWGRTPEEIGLAGRVAVRLGRGGAARTLAARLAADHRPYQFGRPALAEARIAGALRDTVLTLKALAEAFKDGREYDLWIHRTPEFAWLRHEPAFQALVRLKSRRGA